MQNTNNTIIKINIGFNRDTSIIEQKTITKTLPDNVVVFNNDNKKDLWKVQYVYYTKRYHYKR